MNILELTASKQKGRKLTMVTCYDAWSAKILNGSAVDMLLVGDSGVMVMHGFDDTVPATVELMALHVAAVRRGAPQKFIVADMPFLAHRGSLDSGIAAARTLMQAGAHALKIEGWDGNDELIGNLVQAGVPVMGHLGLTPQSIHALGGFRVQGRGDEPGRRILGQARGLEEAGAFAIVLECVPGALANEITASVRVPTIGIGAGSSCDGQVLVLHDLLGLNLGFKPKFLRQYLQGADLIRAALDRYCQDVVTAQFPGPGETYE